MNEFTKILKKEDVIPKGNSVTFGSTEIKYRDIQDLIFNDPNSPGSSQKKENIAAVINVRSPGGPSGISGLDRYKNLHFEFLADATDVLINFVEQAKKLATKVETTHYANTVFKNVYFDD